MTEKKTGRLPLVPETTTGPLGILKKILEVKRTLVVEKTGYDENNDYYYFKADDVANSVRKKLNEVGIIHRTKLASRDVDTFNESYWDKQGRNRHRISGLYRVVLVDVETGEEYVTEAYATGSDIGGDKAPRKAAVQAFKIAMIDLFSISEGMTGMDSDTYEEAPADVADPAEIEAEKKVAARVDAKELNERITELITSDDERWEHINGEVVKNVSKRIGEAMMGKDYTVTKFKKNVECLAALVDALEKGEVE